MHPPSPTLEPEESKPETVEHTPTPWRVLQWSDEKKGLIAIVGPNDEHICDVFPFGARANNRSLDEHISNARLIIRGSNNHNDLVAALEALIDVAGPYLMDSEERATLEAAKRAVARANGAAS